MKIDFTVRFKKVLPKFFNIDRNGRLLEDDKAKYLYYTVVTIDNLLGKKDTRFAEELKHIPGTVFELLTVDENTLDIDESFYEKYFVGWYSLGEDMKEFLTPIKMERIYECMLNHMRDYIDDKGILRIYFELV